jgi:hypothetical protein
MKTFSTIVIGLAIIAGAVGIFHSTTHGDAQVTEATSSAYQDGLYLGRLAAKNGNLPHVSSGRWNTDEDRASFSAGYERGFVTIIAARVKAADAGSAAFQDGLFLGALALKSGERSILSSGRWASARDQELFEQGYRQAYSKVRIQTANNLVRGAQ